MKRFLTLLVISLSSFGSFAQNTKKADKAFEGGEYYKAINEYMLLEDKLSDQAMSNQVTFRIAESYRRMNRPEKAEPYYVKAIRAGYMSPEVYYGYGEILLKQGKYDEAQTAFESYRRSNPGDRLAEAKIASCVFAKANKSENPYFVLQPLETVNTRGSEFGIAYFNDALIYASTGNIDESVPKSGDKISTRTGLGYSKFYMSVPMSGNYGRGEEALGLNKGGKVNEGTFAYDPVNKIGYYTRCDGKENQCYIYFAEFNGNQWREKNRMLIESRKMPIGHPFVMPDGGRIYFTSLMEGGYGKADLWYTDKLPDGTWSKPINLGREINTPGDEGFPFVAGDYLFFASDGHPGYGGLDLYASKIDGNVHSEAINLGKPFNSFADDFNLIARYDFSEGMLVSARRGERSSDDIFRFKGFPFSITAAGRVYDSITGAPMANAPIEVLCEGKTVEKLTADEEGQFMMYVQPDSTYQLKVSVLGYNPATRTYKSTAERFDKLTDWDVPMTGSAAFISGIITAFEIDAMTGIRKDLGPLGDVNVVLYANGRQIKVIRSEPNGEYRFGDIKENTQYMVKAVMKGYFVDTRNLDVGKIVRSVEFCKANGSDMDFELQKIQTTIRLNNIYYDLNKATLRPESMTELDKLVNMLNKNPHLRIEFGSHTDARGSVALNNKLSLQRAQSVVDYLISKGINPSRMTAKGYGKSNLLIKNAKTEAEHEKNRRTEFKVIGESGESLYDTGMEVSRSLSAGEAMSGGGGVSLAGGGYQPPIQQGGYQPPVQQGGYQPQASGSTAMLQNMPFRIQVSASSSMDLNKPEFHRIMQQFSLQVYAERGADGMYRYFVGGYNTADEARAMANRINSVLGTRYFPKAR